MERPIKRKRIKKSYIRRKKRFALLMKVMICAVIAIAVVIISYNQAVKLMPVPVSNSNVLGKTIEDKGDSQEKVAEDTESVKDSDNAKNSNDAKDSNSISPKEVLNKDEKKLLETKKNLFDGIPVRNDNKGVPVLCYHSISKDASSRSSIIVPKEKFREQLQTIKDNGYVTLNISQLNDYLFNNKPVPEKSVVITFDDGYRDNYTEAFPILKELNLNATIFVISSYLGRDLYLTTEEIKEMSDYGLDIESHTVSHVKLSTLPYESQFRELKESKAALEKITNKQVLAIAYPEGKYNEDTKKAAKEAGYTMGFTIQRGYADRDDNSTLINRICIDYTYKPNNIINILKNLSK